MNRLHQIESELRSLDERRSELIRERERLLAGENRPTEPVPDAGAESSPLSPGDKIALFLSRFRCREDVYPRLWENLKTGRKGYSPACRNEWVRGVCEKPRVKCSECPHQAFPSLDETAAREHLTGKAVIGTYAIREDNTCVFLAADFDGAGWKEDVAAYRNSARSHGIEVAVERSRSGEGGHAWIFFREPVPAWLARRFGTWLMAKATALRPTMPLGSYDRFFPNQDSLPSGGFGNLIALPLQSKARENGNTVFLDDDFAPHPDQWAFLSQFPSLDRARLDGLLDKELPESGSEVDFRFEDRVLDVIPAAIRKGDFTGTIRAIRRAQITIPTTNLPNSLVAALKRLATMANPEFFEKQRLRFGTWNIPRFLFCGEIHDDRLVLPRGCVEAALELVRKAGGRMEIEDLRPITRPVDLDFRGQLTAGQQTAVDAMLEQDDGVLVAPPGAGKTVMGCAIIAARKEPTLVLVHRKSLMDQWHSRIAGFLGLSRKEIGILTAHGVSGDPAVVVGMIQTLAKSTHPGALLRPFSQIVIDECHHVPAASFEAVMKASEARHVLGLTATPTRKDGLQRLLFHQCGPVRYRLDTPVEPGFDRVLVLRDIPLGLPPEEPRMPVHEVWHLLANHEERNRMIVSDLSAALGENRCCAVLSDRKDHLALLERELLSLDPGSSDRICRIEGSQGKKARAAVLAQVEGLASAGGGFAVLATSSLIGEGFDLPALDTLFLTLPASFKGRIIQYAGRLHRASEGKKDTRIYDYSEPDHPLTMSMRRKRLAAYRELGYRELAKDSLLP